MVAGEMNHLPTTISKNCREFISKILAANPDKRPTVDEALSHKWLKEATDYRYRYISCGVHSSGKMPLAAFSTTFIQKM